MNGELLVVAGEASGDRAGALVLSKLSGVKAFGMGGAALAGEGLEVLADLRESTAMGLTEVAHRAFGIVRAYSKLRAAIAQRRPQAALLVNYTEFNMRLVPTLSRLGTRVLWYGAPQVWAWRAGRAKELCKHIDALALMLPFEEPLWRNLSVEARYVGHPALEERVGPDERTRARARLGLTPLAPAVAILAGSRPHEVRRLLEPMLASYETVRHERASLDARVLVAPSLDRRTRSWMQRVARTHGAELVDIDGRTGIAPLLPAFDAALVASGTASLECALARVVPVVCYRVGRLTELAARALLKTSSVALPNILLGRKAFAELLQSEANPHRMATELARTLDERAQFLAECNNVEAALGGKQSPSEEVARMLHPWLSTSPVTPSARDAC